jgi:hypothetical protein
MKKKKQTEGVPFPSLKDTPYKSVKIELCEPNTWNPNKMPPDVRAKVQHGIKHLLDSAGHIPPIVVRPHPDAGSGFKWQIIDGYHRWDILRQEGVAKIDAYILDVDTKTAMILTDTLNYLRGSPDPDLHAKYYESLLNEQQMPIAEAAEFLPVSESEIQAVVDAYGIQLISGPTSSMGDYEAKSQEDTDANVFFDVKFYVSKGQAGIIESELSRIGSLLRGKNIRGRALEFMAINSSQTPIDNLIGESSGEPDLEIDPPVKKKKKKKKKTIETHYDESEE